MTFNPANPQNKFHRFPGVPKEVQCIIIKNALLALPPKIVHILPVGSANLAGNGAGAGYEIGQHSCQAPHLFHVSFIFREQASKMYGKAFEHDLVGGTKSYIYYNKDVDSVFFGPISLLAMRAVFEPGHEIQRLALRAPSRIPTIASFALVMLDMRRTLELIRTIRGGEDAVVSYGAKGLENLDFVATHNSWDIPDELVKIGDNVCFEKSYRDGATLSSAHGRSDLDFAVWRCQNRPDGFDAGISNWDGDNMPIVRHVRFFPRYRNHDLRVIHMTANNYACAVVGLDHTILDRLFQETGCIVFTQNINIDARREIGIVGPDSDAVEDCMRKLDDEMHGLINPQAMATLSNDPFNRAITYSKLDMEDMAAESLL